MSRDAPIAAWLHIGPASQATVTVTFPGTHKAFSLTTGQAERLHDGLCAALAEIKHDDGERRTRAAIKLIEGIDA